MSVVDASLTVYFALLVLSFATGGYVPGHRHGDRELAVEMWRMGPWVAGFLVLAGLRLLRRRKSFGEIAFVRLLRAGGTRLAASPRAMWLVTATWVAVLIAVAIRHFHSFGYYPDLEG